MPGFPALHHPPEFAQTHVHWDSDAIQPPHPLSSPFSSCPRSFPGSGSFPMTWLFTSGAVFYVWAVFKKWGLKHIPTVSSTLWYVFWSFTVWMLSVLIQKYFWRLPGDVLYEPRSCVFIGLRTLWTTHKLLLVVTRWETQFHKIYTTEIKKNNNKWGPNQIYKFFHSKWNHKQNEKTTYRKGENICKWWNQQWLNFQNIQTVHTI